MGTGAPPIPPETLWPTGDMPPELRGAMRAEGIPVPAHEVVPSGIPVPPRTFDPAELEAERPAEGDALLASLRRVTGHPAPVQPPPSFAPQPQSGGMRYAFPLSAVGNHADVVLYGEITSKDIQLLVDYLKLTAKRMRDGETRPAGVREHGQDGQDERLSAKRSRVRAGARG